MAIEKVYAFPMSSAQKRLWFLDQLEPGSPFYNIPANLRLTGPLDNKVLERSVNEIIRRHEVLRTTFDMKDGQPVQIISPVWTLTVPLIDLEHIPEREQHDAVRRYAAEEVQRPFVLDEGLLLRVTLLQLAQEDHVLLVTMHHIISDGWSMGIFVRELVTLYGAFSGGRPSPLEELPVQYADYSAWQGEWLSGERLESQLGYWKKQLAGAPRILELPTDRLRPAERSYRAGSVGFEISAEVTKRLNLLSRQTGATLFMTLLAAFAALLSRYSGQEDIVVGTPIANRNHVEIEPLIGFFVNTLVLRMDLSGAPSFRELLGRVRQVSLEAYAHQDVPFEQVVEALQPERSLSVTPVFQVMFALQNAPTVEMGLTGLKIDLLTEFETGIARFDIELYLWETPGGLRGGFAYKKDLFDPASITRMQEHFIHLLKGIAADPDQQVSKIPLLSEAERHRILLQWAGRTEREEKGEPQCAHRLFEAVVEQNAGAQAVVFEEQQLTYRELNERANQLAHHLKALGVGPDVLVGLCVERSIEMIVGILGILKAGGAYMPFDPSHPADRLRFMLEDAGAHAVLTQAGLSERLPLRQDSIVCLDRDWKAISRYPEDNPASVATPGNLIYAIYTSGSTGEPKAVMIEHRNIHNLILGLWKRIYSRYDRPLKVALVAPYVFDASVQQIFGALLLGHALFIVPEDARLDGSSLLAFYQRHGIDLSDGTPTHLRLLLESLGDNNPEIGVKHFIIGGEALAQRTTAAFLRRLSSNAPSITNVYGPAECSVDATCYDVSAETMVLSDTIPIGRPMPNVRIYIVDREENIQPEGVPGEIMIGGDGVGRGYLNREELTSRRFTENPYEKSGRWYRTGDLGRWLPDGNIEFLGRTDRQVKVRGFRIELGEIENTLLRYKGTRDSRTPPGAVTVKRGLGQDAVLCSRCLLPSTIPGVRFDEKGVCDTCLRYEGYRERVGKYFQGKDEFIRLIERAKTLGSATYDCLLLFSGGKDSAYVLHRLVDLGLKVVTFTFDNGYISDTALENITRMASNLRVDHIIRKVTDMKELFLESLEFDSTVCTGCFKALTTLSTQVAYEKGVHMVITGLSRGQILATKLQTLLEQGIFDPHEIEEKLLLFRKMYHARKDRMSRLLNIELPPDVFESTLFVDFFRYDDASVREIKEYLKGKDKAWRQPTDTGFCSTNCMINDAGIYAHLMNKGHHNYAAPISWDIRLGRMTREEGLGDLAFENDRGQRARSILQEIGYFSTKIQDAVVMVRKDEEGNEALCAYFVSNEKISAPELRGYLSKKLPDYMIPGHFLRMEQIPLMPNGKVDRRALPAPGQDRPDLAEPLVEPRTPVEKTIAAIWLEVLKLERVGIHDNFFELGGHSLMATQVASRMRQAFQVEIPLRDLFERPTIAELAARVVAQQLIAAEEEAIETVLAEIETLSDEEAKQLLRGESR